MVGYDADESDSVLPPGDCADVSACSPGMFVGRPLTTPARTSNVRVGLHCVRDFGELRARPGPNLLCLRSLRHGRLVPVV
jgi:hypothetical protein